MRSDGTPKRTPTSAAQAPARMRTTMRLSHGRRSAGRGGEGKGGGWEPRGAQGDIRGGGGPPRHEPAGSERDLPAIADQEIEPDRGDGEDDERDEDGAEDVLARDERHDDEGE